MVWSKAIKKEGWKKCPKCKIIYKGFYCPQCSEHVKKYIQIGSVYVCPLHGEYTDFECLKCLEEEKQNGIRKEKKGKAIKQN